MWEFPLPFTHETKGVPMLRRLAPFARSLVCCLFASAVCLPPVSALAAPAAPGGGVSMMMSIDAALAYNPELKATQEGRQMSAHGVDRAKAGHMPTIASFAGGGISRRSDATTRAYDEDKSVRSVADAGVRLTQPLFHGFGVKYAVETSQAQLEAADMLLHDRGAAIAFDAIVAHTEVVRRTELVRLAKENVRQHAEILKTVQERFDTGVSTIGELKQIQSRHSRAKATLSAYESTLDAVTANYLRVTGRYARGLLPPKAPGSIFPNITAVRDTCLQHNPSLKATLADVRAAQGERGQAESRFYPFFDLQAGPSWSERNSDASLNTHEYSAEVRMNWELFSGGADKANVAIASAKIRQARQNLHALMNVLNEDIESTYSRFESSLVQAKDYAMAKEASRAAREDYYRQFLSAQRSLIDVLDAENDFFYAASQEVLCKGDRLIAAHRLLALAGTLLQTLHISPEGLRAEKPTILEDLGPQIRFGFNSPLEEKAGVPR